MRVRSLPPTRKGSPFHGFTALLCAGLVGVLSLLAVSPTAHAFLHEAQADADPAPGGPADCGHHDCAGRDQATRGHSDSAPADDAGCVVTLFTHGVPVVFDLPALPAAGPLGEVFRGCADAVALIVTGQHLHPLAHAPPVA